ncbi:MAG: precorrin-6y C5,15-methyltransferase (decarboxylating) subunit CbiE [Primorskyibacter sp.]
MAEAPWLTIVGVGEDGAEGLPPASRHAIETADVILAPPRHLALTQGLGAARRMPWPVPFADGLPILAGLRGQRVVVLASGDPFWHGAGRVIAEALAPTDWTALPGPSCFALTAARLGWGLEHVTCMGLHAAPLARLRPHLAPGVRMIVTLRDGDAVPALADYLTQAGFGASRVTILQRLGGPDECRTDARADALPDVSFAHPVCVAFAVAGAGAAMPRAAGKPDLWFDSDGQMTKRPVRALTLSALAPQPGQHLWDIGGGSGSIAIEWLLSDPTTQATSIEPRPDRAARIRANADRLGVDRLAVVTGGAPDALAGLPDPQAVFVGGGLSAALLDVLMDRLRVGTRLVANAVTLESEALLSTAQARWGGDLLRIELAQAAPLGPRRGWKSAYPVVQWGITL